MQVPTHSAFIVSQDIGSRAVAVFTPAEQRILSQIVNHGCELCFQTPEASDAELEAALNKWTSADKVWDRYLVARVIEGHPGLVQ